MNGARQRRLTPLLATLALLLGAVWVALLGGLGRTPRWDAPRDVAALPPMAPVANLPQPVPLAQFAQVWQKPLFSPDRKPAAHAADGGSSLGDLTLTGVILTRSLHMALLHDRQADAEVRLRVGESLPGSGVTLVEVRARSALFDAPSGRTELKLPAGAPIDGGKDGAPPAAVLRPSGDGGMRPGNAASPARMPSAPPLPPPADESAPASAPPSPAVQRLRETINKRRAAQAAAANEGVR